MLLSYYLVCAYNSQIHDHRNPNTTVDVKFKDERSTTHGRKHERVEKPNLMQIVLDTFIREILHLQNDPPRVELVPPILQFTTQQNLLLYKIARSNRGPFPAIVCLTETDGWQESKLYVLDKVVDPYFKHQENKRIMLCLGCAKAPKYVSNLPGQYSPPQNASFKEVDTRQVVAELSLKSCTLSDCKPQPYLCGNS